MQSATPHALHTCLILTITLQGSIKIGVSPNLLIRKLIYKRINQPKIIHYQVLQQDSKVQILKSSIHWLLLDFMFSTTMLYISHLHTVYFSSKQMSYENYKNILNCKGLSMMGLIWTLQDKQVKKTFLTIRRRPRKQGYLEGTKETNQTVCDKV